jgi:hypothetical protein
MGEQEDKPEGPKSIGHASPSSKKGISTKLKAVLAIGIVLILLGLILNFYFQAKMHSELTLSKDFEHDFTSLGETTIVNRDYLFPYNPTYNGTGTSTASPNYTTETHTTIEGVNSSDGYVEFSYVKDVVDQPTFIIDVNTGSSPGGVAMLPSMGPGMPTIPYPFEPYQSTNTTMYLDDKNWTYRSDIYAAKGLPVKTGYARSVLTHHLEQKAYPVYVGTIQNTTVADFEGKVEVKGIETYQYDYSYNFQIPFPIFTNQTTGLTVFLSFNESTSEYHEPTTGALMKQSVVLTYYITILGQGTPNTIVVYSETSDYEISSDDAHSFSSGLFWIRNSPTISLALLLVGVTLVVLGSAMVVKARK